MFKVGDLLVTIGLQYDDESKQVPINSIVTVSESPRHSEIIPIEDQGFNLKEYPITVKYSAYYPHAFRLATPEEINYYNFPNKLEKLLEES